MSTFFEKLTGAKPAPADNTLRPEASRHVGGRETEKSVTHLKVETEERSLAQPEEPLPEEEGELTVDIYDQGDAIVVQSTVAGVKPEDLDISVTNDSVNIRGKRERQEKVEDRNYFYKELFWGIFSRSIILPEEVDEDLSEANLKHGLLTIRLPKRKKGITQKLKVRVT